MTKPYKKMTYFALTLDPIHVGTGGYRLGRVDNTIIREPGTNLPKIPGTSLSGVARAYTAMAIQSKYPNDPRKMKYLRPHRVKAKKETERDKIIYYSCAGKGIEDGEGHCGEPDCEVCIAFGFSKGKTNSSFQGLAQFFDAQILFFPIHSMIGPVWISSPSSLENAGIFAEYIPPEDWGKMEDNLSKVVNGKREDFFFTLCTQAGNYLNLGWLYLPKVATIKINNQEIPDPSQWQFKDVNSTPKKLSCADLKDIILDRAIIVSNSLFSRIVNDNLEVRTSVAIDPATGAAEKGALYSYEAIPRATILWFDVLYNKPEYFRIKRGGKSDEAEEIMKNEKGKIEKADWKWIRDNVEEGLSLFEHLGVGGMGTRGMGRMRILNLETKNVLSSKGKEEGGKND
ncbi:MAG: type III-B CRISPR module RAMP protein Cmr4 [Nitrospirota bacterium]